MRVAFASVGLAPAIDVRRLFRGLALGAAILPGRWHARTIWVCTFTGFRRVHLFPPGCRSPGDDPGIYISRRGKVLLYRREHTAILVAYSGVILGRDFLTGMSEIY